MLALDPHSAPLGAPEQFGLELLLDLSRVVRCTTGDDVVRLRVVDGEAGSLQTCMANRWMLRLADGAVTIPRGVLRLVTAIAGAEAEQRSALRDRFGRVPPESNALVIGRIERSPVVSMAALALRHAAIEVAGRRIFRLLAPWPDGKRWCAAFTHDLDVVAYWPAFTALRLAELARKGEVRRALSVVAAALRSVVGRPVWDGVRGLLDTERTFGVRSTWFVLCGTPTFSSMKAGDLTYAIESTGAQRILAAVRTEGHEIALHGSFETYSSAERMRAQRDRLRKVSREPLGIRQHYLRMLPGETQRAMATAGFGYDSTFGFADRNGFRLGVADMLPAWDASTQSPAGIDELPFIWMDRALSKYRGVESPGAWVRDAIELPAQCRAVEGLFVAVWHPNLTPALGFPDAPAAYAGLVRDVVADSPWVATMEQITAWRCARRSARATQILPDGSVVVESRHTSPSAIELERGDGTATRERVRMPR